nr:cytochrome P450 [Leptographium qinlingense (nom. inval.)]
MDWWKLAVTVAGLVAVYVARRLGGALTHFLRARRARCGAVKSYKHSDTLWGSDWSKEMGRAMQENRLLAWMDETWAAMGTKTFRRDALFMGRSIIYTIDPDNMKAVSGTQWQDFLVEPINGHLEPFVGRVLSTADGPAWHYSRNIVKPYFDRQTFRDVSRLASFTDRLFGLFPPDGTAFDVQPLLSRWFLDATTCFIFGRSRDSLIKEENQDVMLALFDIIRGASMRRMMGRLQFLHRDAKWAESIRLVHAYMDSCIDEALDGLGKGDAHRTDLLWDLAQKMDDRVLLRDQLAAIWIPSVESTAILLSNILFLLSRHPSVWERLQQEVGDLGAAELTASTLENMRYLNWVINETHRVLTAGVAVTRQVARDTTLPRGGGPDGSQPVFCAKGDWVNCNRYLMHRDSDYWGDDAAEFHPERWDGKQPGWQFVPFGGGPRICPAHRMAGLEAAYVVARFCRQFKGIVSCDERPYAPKLGAGVSNAHGVIITVTSR